MVRTNSAGPSIERSTCDLGREMHDRAGLMLFEHAVHRRPVDDVALHEDVSRVVGSAERQRIQIARVGQFVQVDDADRLLGDALPHETAFPMKPAPPVTRIVSMMEWWFEVRARPDWP